LWQQNVYVRLDRIMKTKGRAKVWIERLERGRLRPLRIENRQNMGDSTALVAEEFVKSANRKGWEG
jgi:hypothetical protein